MHEEGRTPNEENYICAGQISWDPVLHTCSGRPPCDACTHRTRPSTWWSGGVEFRNYMDPEGQISSDPTHHRSSWNSNVGELDPYVPPDQCHCSLACRTSCVAGASSCPREREPWAGKRSELRRDTASYKAAAVSGCKRRGQNVRVCRYYYY